MKTKNISKIEFKTEELKTYAKLLINNGFKVYVYDNDKERDFKITWLKISKENKIGNVQLNYFWGFDFSTCHKPNRETGTGFKLNDDGIINPTSKDAEETFNLYPSWAKNKKSVIKYANPEEYFNSELILNYVEVEV